jgi:guanylate kinase
VGKNKMKIIFIQGILVLQMLVVNGSVFATACREVFAPSADIDAPARPRLLVFSAPSGGGKTTLAQMLIKDFPNLKLSISSTTRAPRGQEKDGVDYHFLTKEEFKSRIAAGKFAEWAEVHGNFYGTEISTVKNNLQNGISVLALVDVKGAEVLKASFPGDVYTIFVKPPDLKTLESRLRGRGTDTPEAIQVRLANAKEEMEHAKDFDRVVINDDLHRCYGELKAVLKKLIGQ